MQDHFFIPALRKLVVDHFMLDISIVSMDLNNQQRAQTTYIPTNNLMYSELGTLVEASFDLKTRVWQFCGRGTRDERVATWA